MEANLLDIAAVLLVAAAVVGFINHHLLHLPFTIGLTLAGLAASGVVLALDSLLPEWTVADTVRGVIKDIDFHAFLMRGALSLLLFGGALHINLGDLLDRKWTIVTLATVGVCLSTAIVGVGSWYIFGAFDIQVPFTHCLVFGALISPTDPVAVLGIMSSLNAPKSLETKVAGESLFNDGVGVVVFLVLLAIAQGGAGADASASGVLKLFVVEVGGGITLGWVAGYVTYVAMKTLDEPNLEILMSVALVLGMTLFAAKVHTSAPLACVVAGLFVGNQGRRLAMSDRTRVALDLVWSFIDQALNAILFLLVGLEVVAISFEVTLLFAAACLVPWTLLARWIAVLLPISVLKLRREFSPGAVKVLTWGGLKGGISVALALSLESTFPGRDAILCATYAVVIFSIVVQGLTIGPLIRRVAPATESAGVEG